MVGALLLVMGLSLSGPEQIDTPIAKAEGDAQHSAAEMLAAAPEVIEKAPPEPPWRDFIVRDGDNLSLIFNRAGFTDTDLYRVARDKTIAPSGGSTRERQSVSNRIPTVIYWYFGTCSQPF